MAKVKHVLVANSLIIFILLINYSKCESNLIQSLDNYNSYEVLLTNLPSINVDSIVTSDKSAKRIARDVDNKDDDALSALRNKRQTSSEQTITSAQQTPSLTPILTDKTLSQSLPLPSLTLPSLSPSSSPSSNIPSQSINSSPPQQPNQQQSQQQQQQQKNDNRINSKQIKLDGPQQPLSGSGTGKITSSLTDDISSAIGADINNNDNNNNNGDGANGNGNVKKNIKKNLHLQKFTKSILSVNNNNNNNNNNSNNNGSSSASSESSSSESQLNVTMTSDPPKPAIVSEPITNGAAIGNNGKENNTLHLIVPTNTGQPIKLGGQGLSNEEFTANVDVPEEKINASLEGITKVNEDTHLYYNSLLVSDMTAANEFWKNITNMENFTVNKLLSKSHRRAITVQLTFDFPFYGHYVRNVTVATGGFIYTGDYVHSWLAATQYIAPLMANFDTSMSNDSYIKYGDNGTAFTVLWENVYLQERQEVGAFTFSLTLHSTGDIVFAYYKVPLLIESIIDDSHPVKIGLSDAYIIDKIIFFARRKTIYEYHRVNFANYHILNSTIIYLFAQQTCLPITECGQCIRNATQTFPCTWCPSINRCSTGTDRKRQEWLQAGCNTAFVSNTTVCAAIGTTGNNFDAVQPVQINENVNAPMNDNTTQSNANSNNNNNNNVDNDKDIKASKSAESSASSSSSPYKNSDDVRKVAANMDGNQPDSSGVGLVLGLFIPIILVMTLVLWIFYAYRNPHTKSGQLLIQYRPSQWTWRRGEARYTAATIHM